MKAFLQKITSRKFLVWLIWSIITLYSIFAGKVTDMEFLLKWYGFVSLIYLGVEGGADWISRINPEAVTSLFKKKTEKPEESESCTE